MYKNTCYVFLYQLLTQERLWREKSPNGCRSILAVFEQRCCFSLWPSLHSSVLPSSSVYKKHAKRARTGSTKHMRCRRVFSKDSMRILLAMRYHRLPLYLLGWFFPLICGGCRISKQLGTSSPTVLTDCATLRGQLTLHGIKGHQRLRVQVREQPGEVIWCSVTTPLGVEILRFKATPDQVAWQLPRAHQTGAGSYIDLVQQLQFLANYALLASLLSAQRPKHLKATQHHRSPTTQTHWHQLGDVRAAYHTDRSTKRLSHVHLNAADYLNMDVHYTYHEQKTGLPFTAANVLVRWRRPTVTYHVEATLVLRRANYSASPPAFPLRYTHCVSKLCQNRGF